MSLLITGLIKGQFIEAELYTVFDNECSLAKIHRQPIHSSESHLHILELEKLALNLAYDVFKEFLIPNEWSIRVPPFSANLLINYFGSVQALQYAWSRF